MHVRHTTLLRDTGHKDSHLSAAAASIQSKTHCHGTKNSRANTYKENWRSVSVYMNPLHYTSFHDSFINRSDMLPSTCSLLDLSWPLPSTPVHLLPSLFPTFGNADLPVPVHWSLITHEPPQYVEGNYILFLVSAPWTCLLPPARVSRPAACLLPAWLPEPAGFAKPVWTHFCVAARKPVHLTPISTKCLKTELQKNCSAPVSAFGSSFSHTVPEPYHKSILKTGTFRWAITFLLLIQKVKKKKKKKREREIKPVVYPLLTLRVMT